MTPSLSVLIPEKHDCPNVRWAWREFLLRSNLSKSLTISIETHAASDFSLLFQDEGNSTTYSVPFSDFTNKLSDWKNEVIGFLRNWKSLSSEKEKREFLLQSDNGFRHDLPSLCLGLLDRWEEDLIEDRDDHGRFAAGSSLLTECGVLDRPVVDEIAYAFGRIILVDHGMALKKPDHYFSLGWDIDSAGFWSRKSAASNIRRVFREKGISTTPSLFASMINKLKGQDSHLAFDSIIDQLQDLDSHCTFFAQTNRIHRLDNYNLDQSTGIIRGLRKLQQAGHEVGLHSSYSTWSGSVEDTEKSIRQQTDILRKYFRTPKGDSEDKPFAHRSHYLRHGKRDGDKSVLADFSCDSTIGFSSATGFRLGTAWPVTFDNGLMEFPVHAMDVTLRYGMNKSPEEALSNLDSLHQKVTETGGVFSLIWHPHNLEPILWKGWETLPFQIAERTPSYSFSQLNDIYKSPDQ